MVKGNNLNATSAGTAVAYSEDHSEAQLKAWEPERSAEEIRQDIAARRESITETVDRLSDRFQETFDWRTYVSNYPVAAVGVAAGLGFLAAGIFKHRPTPVERMKEALADCFEDFTDRARSQMDTVTTRKPDLRQTVKAAAMGLLVKAATDYLRNQISMDRQQQLDERGETVNHSRMSQVATPDEWDG